MDLVSIKTKVKEGIQKYKYVWLVLLLGMGLMLLPSKEKTTTHQAAQTEQQQVTQSIDDQLSQILSNIDGAGKVQVYLSVCEGEKTIYQTDEDSVSSEDNINIQVKTVILSDGSREMGLIRQINPPTYKGALILCQGADRPQIHLAIVDAVSKITGLGADKIAVLKMK